MAIIIYCVESNGYGDLMFGLKMAQALQKKLIDEKGYTDHIYFVTDENSVEKIQRIGGDVEFDVKITNPQNVSRLMAKGELEMDCVLTGPAFKLVPGNFDMNGMGASGCVPENVPITFLYEYNMHDSNNLNWKIAQTTKKSWAWRGGISVNKREETLKILDQRNKCMSDVHAGLGGDSGIFISEHLEHAAKMKSNDSRDAQEEFKRICQDSWSELESNPKMQAIRGTLGDQYQQTHDITFEYSSHSDKAEYQERSTLHFLKVHQASKDGSLKNQDVVSIGDVPEERREALVSMKKQLIDQGYTRIEYVDLEKQDDNVDVLYQSDSAENEKVYRMFYVRSLPHTSMDALQVVSDDLVGITGDQSLSEGISANKVMVYQTLNHKKALERAYRNTVAAYAGNNEDVSGFLYLLNHAKTIEEYDKLKSFFKDKELLAKVKSAIFSVAKDNDLGQSIAKSVMQRLPKKLFKGEQKPPLSKDTLAWTEVKKELGGGYGSDENSDEDLGYDRPFLGDDSDEEVLASRREQEESSASNMGFFSSMREENDSADVDDEDLQMGKDKDNNATSPTKVIRRK